MASYYFRDCYVFVFVLVIVSIHPSSTFETTFGQIWSYYNIILFFIKSPSFGKHSIKKWSDKCKDILNRRYHWNLCERVFAQSSNHFLNQYAEKSAGKWYMDRWLKLPKKRENTIYLWEENNSPCSGKKATVHAVYQRMKFWVRDLHAANVCHYLDCWLGVTIKDIAAAWLTLLNTGLQIWYNRNNHYFYTGLVQR